MTEVRALHDFYDLLSIALAKAEGNSEVLLVYVQIDLLLSRVEPHIDPRN